MNSHLFLSRSFFCNINTFNDLTKYLFLHTEYKSSINIARRNGDHSTPPPPPKKKKTRVVFLSGSHHLHRIDEAISNNVKEPNMLITRSGCILVN